jgi:hypothetical protein
MKPKADSEVEADQGCNCEIRLHQPGRLAHEHRDDEELKQREVGSDEHEPEVSRGRARPEVE